MSETDRIRVPTNGHHRPLEAVGDHAASGDAPRAAEAAETADDPLGETGPDLRIAVTPGQLAAGFGILAGLVLLIAGSRRRGKGPQG
jgi:hypothetical protein